MPPKIETLDQAFEDAQKMYLQCNCPELYEGNVQAIRNASGYKLGMTIDTMSVYRALCDAARLHVSFNDCYCQYKSGKNDTVQKLNVTYMGDAWRGILARRGILVQSFAVTLSDVFTLTNGVIVHQPNLAVTPDESNIIASWAKFTMPDGREAHYFLRRAELDKRAKMSTNKTEFGPWKTNFEAMCCTKAISHGARQLGKTITGVDVQAVQPYDPDDVVVDYSTGEVVTSGQEQVF